MPVLYEFPTDSVNSTREDLGHMGRCLTPPHRGSAVGHCDALTDCTGYRSEKKQKIKKGSERCQETEVNPMEALLLLKISEMR